MSFDIFFQRAGPAAGDVGALVMPLVEERDSGWARLRTTDGEADVYGMDALGEHFMITHAAGRMIWDVMYELAVAGGFAVIPVGCGTCVPPGVEAPPEFPEPVTVVRSGQDLLDAVEQA